MLLTNMKVGIIGLQKGYHYYGIVNQLETSTLLSTGIAIDGRFLRQI